MFIAKVFITSIVSVRYIAVFATLIREMWEKHVECSWSTCYSVAQVALSAHGDMTGMFGEDLAQAQGHGLSQQEENVDLDTVEMTLGDSEKEKPKKKC